jgi:hypothetical protein
MDWLIDRLFVRSFVCLCVGLALGCMIDMRTRARSHIRVALSASYGLSCPDRCAFSRADNRANDGLADPPAELFQHIAGDDYHIWAQ